MKIKDKLFDIGQECYDLNNLLTEAGDDQPLTEEWIKSSDSITEAGMWVYNAIAEIDYTDPKEAEASRKEGKKGPIYDTDYTYLTGKSFEEKITYLQLRIKNLIGEFKLSRELYRDDTEFHVNYWYIEIALYQVWIKLKEADNYLSLKLKTLTK